jgi:signal transduction histidine kinase/CheY-like chemotaxis protein
VRVPDNLAAAFAEAEATVARYFELRRDDPEHGTIEIFGERYVLVRAASLSVEFFRLCEDLYGPGREAEAAAFAQNILFDLAHAIGKSDAHNFHTKMGLVDPIAKLSAGPVHFAFSGWAFVELGPESEPRPDDGYFLFYDHPYSFEADAWIRAGQRRDFAVCIMNAGYSSGWCEESFGVKLVSAELECRARGDERCRFVMGTPERVGEHVERILGKRGARLDVPDFFARKRMEDELLRAKADLERRVAERTAQLQRAYEERAEVERKLRHAHQLEGLGRLAGGVAHDFNNLVGIILANAAALRQRIDDGDPRARFVDDILGTCDRAGKLTRQLLAFGRAPVTAHAHVELCSSVTETSRTLERLLGEDIELVIERPDEDLWVVADPSKLDQVVLNLAVNARDAMPTGGRLTIALAAIEVGSARAAELSIEPGPGVQLTVRDEGVGIAPEALVHIFEPFFTTKGGRGSGVGLSTVYGLVRETSGAIVVRSEPRGGTVFDVTLPRVPPPVAGLEERRARPAPAVAPRARVVLLVEDEVNLRRIVATILEDAGYHVLAAADVEDAQRLARARPDVAVLLTDVVMPGLRGPELAARIRAFCPEMRVLYMSGYAEERAEPDPVPGGAGWLGKPFRPEELLAKLGDVLSDAG